MKSDFSSIQHHTQLLHLGTLVQRGSPLFTLTFAYRMQSSVASLSLVRHAASLQQATVLARCQQVGPLQG